MNSDNGVDSVTVQVFFLIQIHPQLDLINQTAYLHFSAVHSVIMNDDVIVMITEYTAEK